MLKSLKAGMPEIYKAGVSGLPGILDLSVPP
jgi:hypothetical protein